MDARAIFLSRLNQALGVKHPCVDWLSQLAPVYAPPQMHSDHVLKALHVAIVYEAHALHPAAVRFQTGAYLVRLLALEGVDEYIVAAVQAAMAAEQAAPAPIHGVVVFHILAALHTIAVEAIGDALKPCVTANATCAPSSTSTSSSQATPKTNVVWIEDWQVRGAEAGAICVHVCVCVCVCALGGCAPRCPPPPLPPPQVASSRLLVLKQHLTLTSGLAGVPASAHAAVAAKPETACQY
jgi:hypothetical protein